MSRDRAESTPTVTVPPSPNGLPIAIVHAPGCTASESPQAVVVMLGRGSIFSTAMSVAGSRPTSRAGEVCLSENTTWISFASATTWLLVTM
jgi:hypothetical protein